jgi:hypothetical protein
MFKPSEAIAGSVRTWASRSATCLAALVLSAPLCSALAGVTTTETKESARPAASEKPPGPSVGAYQLRCWQDGHLLFEENQIALQLEGSQYSVKVSGTDRKGQPIYVAETKNATCLIRQSSEERAWPAIKR